MLLLPSADVGHGISQGVQTSRTWQHVNIQSQSGAVCTIIEVDMFVTLLCLIPTACMLPAEDRPLRSTGQVCM